jgi:hypothetical protein
VRFDLESFHGVHVRALLRLAEPMLSLDPDVVETVSELEPLDLGALRLGRSVGDQGEEHAPPLQGVDHLMGIGEQVNLLLPVLGKSIRQPVRHVARRNRPPCRGELRERCDNILAPRLEQTLAPDAVPLGV